MIRRTHPEDQLGDQIVEFFPPMLSEPLAPAPRLILANPVNQFAHFQCTDLGNAKLFADRNAGRLRYCHHFACWFVWDGKRWKRDADGEVYRCAEEFVRSLYAEASKIDDEKRRQEVAKWATRCEERRKIDAMLALARHQRTLLVSPDHLDSDPMLLNVENGTIDLRSGDLGPHDPEHLITKLTPVVYNESATSKPFDDFLSRTFGSNVETIQFVQKAVGYSLTGDTSEQCLFFCHGSGANGKSTLLGAIQYVLGEYARSTPTDTLLAKREAGGIPNDIARLKGARLVAAQETEGGRRLAESRVKALTGGDRITARFMRGEWFDFEPTFKIWLSTNHKPEIKNTDHAIWRRIRLIPFDCTIPEGDRDPHLLDKLKVDAPAILRWSVDGCLSWRRDRLQPPEAVSVATAAYRSESDLLGTFLEERCRTDQRCEVKAGSVYSAYRSWAELNGESPVTNTAFGREMTARGFARRKTRDGSLYKGLAIRTDERSRLGEGS